MLIAHTVLITSNMLDPARAPDQATAEALESAQNRLRLLLRKEVIAAGVARVASLGVAKFSGTSWRCVGADVGSGAPKKLVSVYDLASITKPFFALAVARLVARGELSWNTRLCSLLPQSANSPCADATLEHLLSHRAGLEAHLELFAPLRAQHVMDRNAALRVALHARRSECRGPIPELGFAPVYSDLGYILASAGVAYARRCSLDDLIRREVCTPLGLQVDSARGWLNKDPLFLERVAKTEYVPFRGGTLRGVVHDENAWALVGHGLMGHAGLFGTLDDILALGRCLLDVSAGRSMTWLTRETLSALLADRPGGTLRLGFDAKSVTASSAGTRASRSSFGHLGFTGTSVWCDPEADAVTVLLTNRVYPTRSNTKIRACRPVVHEALFEVAEWLDESPRESAPKAELLVPGTSSA